MTLIRQLGISIIFLIIGCKSYNFYDFKEVIQNDYNKEFNLFSKESKYFSNEQAAVQNSFFGNYFEATEFAKKDIKSRIKLDVNEATSVNNLSPISDDMRHLLLDEVSKLEKVKDNSYKILKSFLDLPANLDTLFSNVEINEALPFIINNAKKFHVILINEAHYSSTNRNFMRELLPYFKNNGYSYLAVETIYANDSLLNSRGYPVFTSGYYTQDIIFSNMIREALKLGFTIIPYDISGKEAMEQTSKNFGYRDSIQALNIYNNANLSDTHNKVLVYAGYGHILEDGPTMGYYLRKLINADLLSIDQIQMVDEYKGANLYLDYARKYCHIREPSIICYNNLPVITPLEHFGVDLQITHPPLEWINGRPKWLYSKDKTSIPLPKALVEKYGACLIQAKYVNESNDAMPIDQFIINGEKPLVLPVGDFLINIVNKDGTLIAQCKLENL